MVKMWRKRNPYPCWWENKLGWLLWKRVWKFLKKLKIELPYDWAIPPLCIYPKGKKSGSQRDICTVMLIAALFTIAKIWKSCKCPSTDEWRRCGIHIHIHFYGEILVKVFRLPVTRWINSGDLIYGIVIIVNALLYTWKLIRE